MPGPKNLPRFRRRCDLAAGIAGTGGNGFDQLAVRGYLGAVAEVERVFQPGAEMATEIGTALMQRPDLAATDRGDLPMPFRTLELQQDRQQVRVRRHA